jgi:hypothetical protein
MGTATGCVVKSFERPDEVRPFEGHGKVHAVDLGGRVVGRGEFEPGWHWHDDVRPTAATPRSAPATCSRSRPATTPR